MSNINTTHAATAIVMYTDIRNTSIRY